MSLGKVSSLTVRKKINKSCFARICKSQVDMQYGVLQTGSGKCGPHCHGCGLLGLRSQ